VTDLSVYQCVFVCLTGHLSPMAKHACVS